MPRVQSQSKEAIEIAMASTADLLAFAENQFGSVYALAIQIGLSPNCLNTAKCRGKLSPELAGVIALHTGEDPVFWMLTSIFENQDRLGLIARLQTAIGPVRPPPQNGYLTGKTIHTLPK
jgi:hypothetical protein